MAYVFSLAVVFFDEDPYLEKALRLAIDFYKELGLVFKNTSHQQELPENCYIESSDKYSAECLISWLSSTYNGYDKVLGLTLSDIKAQGTNFVFGLAEFNGRSAVVSGYRLYTRSSSRYVPRLAKEIVHEIGHLFGLEHCENPRCVMSFSGNVIDVDEKDLELCSSCKEKLLENLYLYYRNHSA